MSHAELSFEVGDNRVTIGEHEIRRGAKRVKELINSLRRSHPELKILQQEEGVPIAAVRIHFMGEWTDVSIDPLNIGARLGVRTPDSPLPPHIQPDPDDPDSPWSAG